MMTCKRCGGTYSENFFYKNTRRNICGSHGFHKIYKSAETVCVGCQQYERDSRKWENRPREKARRTIRTHAEKYMKLGYVSSKDEFISKYGWEVGQMAHDIEHGHSNGCPYCQVPFSEMGNGLSDITLDILNPALEPYYTTNTRWACSTCNQAKKRKSPEEWGQYLQDYKEWVRRKRESEANTWYIGGLFSYAIDNGAEL